MTLFLDVETTGLDPSGDRLIEIGIVDDQGDIAFQSLINPDIPIPPDATAVHGITNEMVSNAPHFDQIAGKVRDLLVNDGQAVIYNAEFDMAFLPTGFFDRVKVDCALERYRLTFGRRRKIAQVAKAAGHVWSSTIHRAVADAMACRSIWRWLDATAGGNERQFDNLNGDELVRQAWIAHLKMKEAELELFRYKHELIKRAAGDKWVKEIPGVCRITVSTPSETADRIAYHVDRAALQALPPAQRALLFDLGVIRETERGKHGASVRVTFTDRRPKAGAS